MPHSLFRSVLVLKLCPHLIPSLHSALLQPHLYYESSESKDFPSLFSIKPVSRTSILCNQTLTRASSYLWNKVQTSSPQIYDVNTNYFLKIYHPTSLEMFYVQVEKKNTQHYVILKVSKLEICLCPSWTQHYLSFSLFLPVQFSPFFQNKFE